MKKLMISLSCGHSIILDKRGAAQAAHGNHMQCPKCPDDVPERRVVERSWIADEPGK